MTDSGSKYFNNNEKRSKLKTKTASLKSDVEFRVLEDKEDLTEIRNIASQATRKGFERAKKIAHEIVIVQNGKLVRKRSGKPNEIISKLEERQVVVGQTTSLEF